MCTVQFKRYYLDSACTHVNAFCHISPQMVKNFSTTHYMTDPLEHQCDVWYLHHTRAGIGKQSVHAYAISVLSQFIPPIAHG